MKQLIDRIAELSESEMTGLLSGYTPEDAAYAAQKARQLTDNRFGRGVYIRGLIEISNICKNDCLYCGIRCSNKNVCRYRLEKDSILACCENGYRLGFRTFVLQGGEDPYYTDRRLTDLLSEIKRRYPDCAVTLSLGERSEASYRALFEAGADRYLLRHETASELHYKRLHPENMSFENRMDCLHILKGLGYQTGCGMMVGSPFQTAADLAADLAFLRKFRPQMVGIGPFIPQHDTPFASEKQGSVELTLFLLSLIRLMLPDVLLPATTALQTLRENGRILGLDAGANVIMPNLSPADSREKYALYDRKSEAYADAAEQLDTVSAQLKGNGYYISDSRGDYSEKKIG